MTASLRLCVFLVIFAVPLLANSDPNSQYGAPTPLKKSGFSTFLFKILGFGDSEKPNLNQVGPCGIPLTTTPSSVGYLCPFPPPGQNQPLTRPGNDPTPPGPFPGQNFPPSQPYPPNKPYPPNQPYPPNKPYPPTSPGKPFQPGQEPFDPSKNFNNGPYPSEPYRPNSNERPYPANAPSNTNPEKPIKNTPTGGEPSVPVVQPGKPFDPNNPTLVNPSPQKPNVPSIVYPEKPTNPNPSVFGPESALILPVSPIGPQSPNSVDPYSPKKPFPSGPNNVGQVVSNPYGPGPNPYKPPRPSTKPRPSQPQQNHDHLNLTDPNVFRPLPCSSIQPYIPSGFTLPSVENCTRNSGLQCPLTQYRQDAPCSLMDSLDRLGLSRMRSLIIASGLDVLFLRTSGYTLLAPLDIAFKRLPQWFINSLDTDEKLREAFVRNHLIKEDVPLRKMGDEFLLLNDRPGGNRIRINKYYPDSDYPIYTADGARIVFGDILVANARIHLTDKAIMPNPPRNAAEYLSERAEFESFWNLVKNSKLEIFQSDRPITVLIPLNEAVDNCVKSLSQDVEKLTRFIDSHVLNGTLYGSGLINNQFETTNYNKEIKFGISSDGYSKYLSTINGHIRVIKSDVPLTNGVAHIIEECISEKSSFYMFEESDEFQYEFGVISKRNMHVEGKEKFLDF